MKPIQSIAELEEVMKNHDPNVSYFQIMKSIDIPYDEFERHFSWKEEHYTRNSIIKNDTYELLVICWEEGQDSPIHDYDSKEAWIHIIRGQLKEEKYVKRGDGPMEKVSTVTLGVNDFSYMSGHVGLHRYVNTYESRTVSLHLYVNPLKHWNEYDPATDSFRVRTVDYDS
jgi:cysteine dioxygenase